MTSPVILAPLDGTRRALGALPVARMLSELEGAPLRILHVTGRAQPLSEIAERLGVKPSALQGTMLEARTGDPAEAILRAAAENHVLLIVLSTHTAEATPEAAIGRTALAVLRGAPCPVVLVDPDAPLDAWRLRRVLVPHEGSPTISDALRPAAALARKAGAELIVLQVADARVGQESGSIAPPAYLDQPQHEWPLWAEEFMLRLSSACPLDDVRVRLLVRAGEPAEETLRVARQVSADLIFLAWKGDWGPARAETLKAVMREAPCPLMVTRVPSA